MAAAVLHNKVSDLVTPKVIVTSSGTSNYHVGEGPNGSSLRTWESAGYKYKHVAKQFHPESFAKQDLILCMDLSNRAMVLTAAKSEVQAVQHVDEFIMKGQVSGAKCSDVRGDGLLQHLAAYLSLSKYSYIR